ncbi:DUF86 domain-containing protein [Candidatus Pacearchaeota archaeon]|nr:DUF86 domain-containing protein [Candidatus Pacearchaeota archaeon]
MKNRTLDKEKIISKLDELDSYLEELNEIKIDDFNEYIGSIEKKRASERLLQVSIEVVIDVCNIIVSNLKLGIPYDEDMLFKKLKEKDIISEKMKDILRNLKGFRNVLVHKYGEVDNERVFENIEKLQDFDDFKEEILTFLKKYKAKIITKSSFVLIN